MYMEVISEAVPMTDGEVYALLRRRRDLRTGAKQPPFNLQMPSEAASVNPSSSSGGGNYGRGGGGGRRGNQGPGGSSSAALPNHLVVLLTEVNMMRYVTQASQHLGEEEETGAGGRRYAVSDIYGPSSVCALRPEAVLKKEDEEEERKAVGADETEQNAQKTAAKTKKKGSRSPKGKPLAHEEAEGGSDEQSHGAVKREKGEEEDEEGKPQRSSSSLAQKIDLCTAQLATTRPGTVRHVKTMDHLCSLLEEKGRETEVHWVQQIRQVVRRLQEAYPQLLSTTQEVPAAAESASYLLSAPTPLLAQTPSLLRGTSSSHSTTTAAAGVKAEEGGACHDAQEASHPPLLTEWDVLRLLNARPVARDEVLRVLGKATLLQRLHGEPHQDAAARLKLVEELGEHIAKIFVKK